MSFTNAFVFVLVRFARAFVLLTSIVGGALKSLRGWEVVIPGKISLLLTFSSLVIAFIELAEKCTKVGEVRNG